MAAQDYSPQFFASIRAGIQRSAAAVVPLMWTVLDAPSTVIDVGCGEGWWAEAFSQRGAAITVGVDGPGPLNVHHHVGRFVQHDLERRLPLEDLGAFELAICLEVVEHLSPRRGLILVDELCQLAPLVMFSAAVPGQRGVGHINERWPGHWIKRFQRNDFSVSGAARWWLWDDDRVAWWYRQNLLVAARWPAQFPELFESPMAEPWPVAHPAMVDQLLGVRR